MFVLASLVGFAVATGLFVFEVIGLDVSTTVGMTDFNPTALGEMVEEINDSGDEVGLGVIPFVGMTELEDRDGA